MNEILGLAGTALIVFGWFFETKEIIRTRHSPLDVNFGMLYLAGSILLTVYAFAINSAVFAALNALAALMALASLYYKHEEKRRRTSLVASREHLDSGKLEYDDTKARIHSKVHERHFAKRKR